MLVDADVKSSSEAECVAPAGARGSVDVNVMSTEDLEGMSVQQYAYESEASVVSVAPVVGSVEGGTVVSVVVNGLLDGGMAWCRMGGVVVGTMCGVQWCVHVCVHVWCACVCAWVCAHVCMRKWVCMCAVHAW